MQGCESLSARVRALHQQCGEGRPWFEARDGKVEVFDVMAATCSAGLLRAHGQLLLQRPSTLTASTCLPAVRQLHR